MNTETLTFIVLLLTILYCAYIIIYEKRSIRSKIIESGVSLSKYKTIISNEERYDKYLKKISSKNEKKYVLPKFKFKHTIEKHTISNIDYYIINKNSGKKKIFYLHGGSYIENPLIFHWLFLDDIASLTDTEIIIPIYPKAPHYSYKYAYKKILNLYKKIFNNNNNVILMGDSAGGGMALGLSILLKNNSCVIPSNIIVLSPWVDISMSNKEINKTEKYDPFLSKNALIKAGILWSNKDDKSFYLLSPINGNFNNVGKITIFVGTHEILLPDIRKLKYKLHQSKINFNYFEYKRMNHVFPLHPIPEAKKAKEEIKKIINQA